MGKQSRSRGSHKSRARIRVSDIISEVLEEDKLQPPAADSAMAELGLLDDLAADEGPSSREPGRSRSRVAIPANIPESKRFWRSGSQDPLVGRELRGLRIERKVGEGAWVRFTRLCS